MVVKWSVGRAIRTIAPACIAQSHLLMAEHRACATRLGASALCPWSLVVALHPGSWFDRQHTEPQRCLHHVYLREASSHEPFRYAALRLPRMGGKTERNAAPSLEDPPHFSQPRLGIRPDLHGVHRQCFLEGLI